MNNRLFYPVRRYGEYCAWPKRRGVITRALVPLLSDERTLLDLGCGDGSLAEELKQHCCGLTIHGVETHFPAGVQSHIPCCLFDGRRLPFRDNTYDACLLLDVLHHSRSSGCLLEEAARVARHCVIVKDHDYRSRLDFHLMKWGDYLGNRLFGTDLPYNFRRWEEFETMFRETGLSIVEYDDSLRPAGSLELHHHFLVKLVPRSV
jgi:SAM-dependent methyltransferase